MKKKYELTEETKTLYNLTVLHRIRAVRDLTLVDGTVVQAGDLGGWVEEEYNLLHGGSAWIYDNAVVYDGARVEGDARVYGEASVSGKSIVYDKAQIFGSAEVYDSWISGKAQVFGSAKVYNADISGKALVKDILDYSVYKSPVYNRRWNSGMLLTYTRSDKMWSLGNFRGTGEDLIANAYTDSRLSGRCYEAIVRAQEAINKSIEEENEAK